MGVPKPCCTWTIILSVLSQSMPSYLITGASRGLGYAWIKVLSASPENTVIALVRDSARTRESLLDDKITNVHIVSADITDSKALRHAAQEVSQWTGGGLDVLVNNAAVLGDRSAWTSFADLPAEILEEDLSETFQVNVVGVALTINAFLPLIRKGQIKKVITISSMLADVDLVNDFQLGSAGPYSVSKAASNVLMAKYHASIGADEGILFMSITPGVVSTRTTEWTDAELEGRKAMGMKLKAYAPHFQGPLMPEDSVRMQAKVLHQAKVETHGGKFVSHYGSKQWL